MSSYFSLKTIEKTIGRLKINLPWLKTCFFFLIFLSLFCTGGWWFKYVRGGHFFFICQTCLPAWIVSGDEKCERATIILILEFVRSGSSLLVFFLFFFLVETFQIKIEYAKLFSINQIFCYTSDRTRRNVKRRRTSRRLICGGKRHRSRRLPCKWHNQLSGISRRVKSV